MKRVFSILLAAVLALSASCALAEQKVQLPENSRYTITLPDGMEYDGPGEKPDDARFAYLSEALGLEVLFFCYDRGGAALRDICDILLEDNKDAAIYQVNGIEMIVYRVEDPDDPPQKGMKCIGYAWEEGNMIQEISFWYATKDAAALTEEIIGSITDKD